MNKQELIDKLKKLLEMPSEVEGYDFDYGHDFGIRRAIVLVKQLDEQQEPINDPEKPVVPQFVADWYKKSKDDLEYNLYKLCTHFREHKLRFDLQLWFSDNDNKPIETLVMMHKFGYEVEKEEVEECNQKR